MATFEKLSSNKVKLSFVVAPEKFDEALQTAYHKMVKKISIPGFRKGHAPMKVIENYYGASVFYEEALDVLFPALYQEAVAEHSVQPVDRPELDVEQIGKGQELKFSVEVFVRPDVKLGEYKHLGIEKEVAEVTDDDVSAEIERGTAQGHDLVLGSGSFIPGFEDQLVGAEVGSEVEVHVTFPEQYHAENLAGKPVVFKVKVNSIREKEVPALDEDFVKEVSETANTVDEYKAEIREKLEKQAEAKADVAFENAVIEKVAENAEIDIPQGMIEEQIDSMLRDMEMRMMYQGMRLDDYFKYTGQTREQVREMYKAPAEERVRTQLVIEAVMKAEDIKATDEEIDAEIQKYADQSKKSLDELKATLGDGDRNYFAEVASLQKTVDFLKANAK